MMKKHSIILVATGLILIAGLFVAGCVSDSEPTGSDTVTSMVTPPGMATGTMTGPGDMQAGNMTGEPPEGMPAGNMTGQPPDMSGNMTGQPPEGMHRGNMTAGERPSGTPPATLVS